jgi:hypothetical protein
MMAVQQTTHLHSLVEDQKKVQQEQQEQKVQQEQLMVVSQKI